MTYTVIGVELSPYSVKVRAYLRFKGLPHEWLVRSPDVLERYRARFKLPLIPLVITPDDDALQDSTPIMERLEATHPDPAIVPDDPCLGFLSMLIEEFGDEWGNKWMFHYRWARDVDQASGALRIARLSHQNADPDDRALADHVAAVRERMTGRVWFVGSNAETAPQIEAGFMAALERLEPHLAARPYLFGGRPAFADFGLWAQLYEMWTDPTPGAIIGASYPATLAWIHRMAWPQVAGPFEPWEALAPTLAPFMAEQIGARFLPWSVANAAALADGLDTFSVPLAGGTWTQTPQKYHARSLTALRAKHAAVPDRAALDRVLADLGCLDPLLS